MSSYFYFVFNFLLTQLTLFITTLFIFNHSQVLFVWLSCVSFFLNPYGFVHFICLLDFLLLFTLFFVSFLLCVFLHSVSQHINVVERNPLSVGSTIFQYDAEFFATASSRQRLTSKSQHYHVFCINY